MFTFTDTFTFDINKFKFCTADKEQVINDFIRDQRFIFINDVSLKEMKITVSNKNLIQENDLLQLWAKLFTGANAEQLPYWQRFANTLFHQGGLLYAFESILKEKMSLPDNGKAYIPENEGTKKEVRISFDGQILHIKEKCVFTEIKDPNEDDKNLTAKAGGYLIKAELLHRVELIEKNGKFEFEHVISQPEFKCKNSKLEKCLEQTRLSVADFIKALINKIFRLKSQPNQTLFFQKPCYRNNISLEENNGNNFIQGTSYH